MKKKRWRALFGGALNVKNTVTVLLWKRGSNVKKRKKLILHSAFYYVVYHLTHKRRLPAFVKKLRQCFCNYLPTIETGFSYLM